MARYPGCMIVVTLMVSFICVCTSNTMATEYDDNKYLVESKELGGFLDIHKIRIDYTRSENYRPNTMAFWGAYRALRESYEQKQYARTVYVGKDILKCRYVDLKAHFYIARAYDALRLHEKANYHHEVIRTILKSITDNGSGKTPEDAFEVVYSGEEDFLLAAMGLDVVGQRMIYYKGDFYDMFEVGLKDEKKGLVFFRISNFFNLGQDENSRSEIVSR